MRSVALCEMPSTGLPVLSNTCSMLRSAARARSAVSIPYVISEKAFDKTGKPVLGISHKATLRILGASLTEAPVRLYRKRWPQDECALNLIELRKDKEPFLRLWNDTAHLGPDPGATTRGGK